MIESSRKVLDRNDEILGSRKAFLPTKDSQPFVAFRKTRVGAPLVSRISFRETLARKMVLMVKYSRKIVGRK